MTRAMGQPCILHLVFPWCDHGHPTWCVHGTIHVTRHGESYKSRHDYTRDGTMAYPAMDGSVFMDSTMAYINGANHGYYRRGILRGMDHGCTWNNIYAMQARLFVG